MEANERIRQFLKHEKITIQNFEVSISRTNGYLNHTKSPTTNVLCDIIRVYPQLNIEWLITGNGNMLKDENQKTNLIAADSKPEYEKNTSKYIQQLENENKRLIADNERK